MTFGQKIRIARGKESQEAIAKKLAISANTLGAYENNRILPPLESFKKICLLFDLSADDIFSIKDTSNTPNNKGKMLNHKLANIRDNMDFSQEQMANFIDVSISTWSKYESGNRNPPLDRFKIICERCKVSADYLLGLKEKKLGGN